MFKILKIIIPTILFVFFIQPALAENKVNVYFFYGDGCPHCEQEMAFLNKLGNEMDGVDIYSYEVWNNLTNAKILAKLSKELNINNTGVPITIISDKAIVGYLSDKTTGEKIKSIIKYYIVNECTDAAASILGTENINNNCVHNCDEDDLECRQNCDCRAGLNNSLKIPTEIDLPIFGKIETKNISLPILTIIIAALDGFNPCAMWTLLFLISLLLGLSDRKRMWLLGSTFIIASGLVYFLFLSAWLNLFLFLGFVFWIRVIVGLVALASGGYHLRDYWQNRDGKCKVTGSEKRKEIFTKLKNIVQTKKIWLALGGIVVLAFAVNLVELVCSAGLPAVYTQVLALANLAGWQYYGYLFLYIFIFILDDLLIFIIAMATLQMKAVGSRYTRWSGLVGGVIMLVIGILLLFKPGWLMF